VVQLARARLSGPAARARHAAPLPVRALLLIAIGAACAAAPERPAPDPCGADEAFERGLEDGGAGRAPELGWLAEACEAAPSREPDAAAAYQHGHAAGLASRPRPQADGAWRCEVQARGDVFRGDAADRDRAAAAARARCRERNGERYCREVSCRAVE
jgi:hypothetical protein